MKRYIRNVGAVVLGVCCLGVLSMIAAMAAGMIVGFLDARRTPAPQVEIIRYGAPSATEHPAPAPSPR